MTAAETTSNAGPLSGHTVVVTRAASQSDALVEPLEELGATVIAFPVIETVDPEDWGPADAAIDALDSYDWVVLTSTNAVERFLARMALRGRTATELRCCKVAVVGMATARALEAVGIRADLVPTEYRAEGLVEAFERMKTTGVRVLIPRALKGRDILPQALRDAGCRADVVPVYRTVRAQVVPEVLHRLHACDVDVVTFTSPSTFANFLGIVRDAGLDVDRVMSCIMSASIGPVTSTAIRRAGYDVPIEAQTSTVDGLVDAIAQRFGRVSQGS